MKLNLQFFAAEDTDVIGGVGEEVSDVNAEQTETANDVDVTDATETETEVTETESKRDYNKDAIYADARRRAEREQQEKVDAEYVRRFGHLKNPITGQMIRSQADYLEALDAQEQISIESKLKTQGLDMDLVQKLIDNTPVVRQARELMEKTQRDEAMKQIDADVQEISTLDDTIKSFKDVPKDVIELAQKSHISLTNAYKILNYGKVTEKNAAAMRQNAVNQIRGKQHLTPLNGVATDNTEVEIPNELRSIWAQVFPDKSYAEMRKLYNKQLKN